MSSFPSIHQFFKKSIDYLSTKEPFHCQLFVQEIFCHVLKCRKEELYLDFSRKVEKESQRKIEELLEKKAKGVPLEYLLKQVEFFGCSLEVSPDVLIPRPETEILVSLVIEKIKNDPLEKKVLWDIACGSGCIGLSLQKIFPRLSVVLSDLSEAALQLAKRNGQRNGLKASFRKGDLFSPFLGEKVDYLVCNPPYISNEEYESLEKGVKDFEPKMALVGGETGLEFYQRIADGLSTYLQPKGKVFLEIGFSQGEKIKEIFLKKGWPEGEVIKDWSGKDRFFFLERE